MKKITFKILFFACFALTIGLNAQEAESAASLYNDGLAKVKAKEYDKALPLMEKAIEAADPESESDAKVIGLAKRNGAIAAYYVGNDYRKADDFEAALETYDKGIAFAPGFYANYIGRAQALEGKGDVAASVNAYIAAGDICLKSKKADKAEKMYSKAENIVAVAWGDKKWAETEAYAAAFLEKRESPEVHYYLAYALKGQGKNEEAVAQTDQAIAQASGSAANKYYFLKAEILESMGQPEAAIEAYKKVSGSKYGERAKFKVEELSNG